ncbi:hypothetical protein ACLQ29_30450 [Micromonospora sp. DT228]|uniref:hypothetical protein n=1 Tax=Micromonospora sp. DT228 TaxID=3393443 RepID=UPI003CE9F7BB
MPDVPDVAVATAPVDPCHTEDAFGGGAAWAAASARAGRTPVWWAVEPESAGSPATIAAAAVKRRTESRLAMSSHLLPIETQDIERWH